MDKRFEKIVIILMALSTVFLLGNGIAKGLAINTAGEKDEMYENPLNDYPGIMRFHVIANSDSEEDQKLKLKVRDYVLERLQSELADETLSVKASHGDDILENKVIRRYIEDNLAKIESWGKEALHIYDSSYNCTASVGVRHIPAKYYDDVYFPEGNYEALTITIGEGNGQNWWCVVFPPLCLVDGENSPYTDKLDLSDGDKIKLKSKLLELMTDAKEKREIKPPQSIFAACTKLAFGE